jgi:hypothetical protein
MGKKETWLNLNIFFSRPGFTRLNLPFFVTNDEIEYILDAVEFIAAHGWKFLPLVCRKEFLRFV